MPVLMPCPNCQSTLSLPDHAAGKKVRCQGCNHVFQVPGAAATPSTMAPVDIPGPPPVPPSTTIPSPVDAKKLDESVQAGVASPPLANERDQRPARNTPAPAHDRNDRDEDQDDRAIPRKSRHRKPSKSSSALVIGIVFLVAGGFLLVGLLVLCGGVGWFMWAVPVKNIQPVKEAKIAIPVEKNEDNNDLPINGPVEPRDKNVVDVKKEPPVKIPADPLTRRASLAAILQKIQPPLLGEDREVRTLPDVVNNVVAARAGRYLLLQINRMNQIAVFDVNEAKVTRYIPLAGPRARIAAGRDHLMIGYPDQQKLQRWSLIDFKKEAEVMVIAKFDAIAMGAGSRGPLYLASAGAGSSTTLFDIEKMRPLRLPPMKRELPRDAFFLRASLDGTLFGLRPEVGGEPHTMAAIHLRGSEISLKESWGFDSSVIVPGHDSKYFYSGGTVSNIDLQPQYPNPIPKSFAKPFVPGVHGPYFMKLEYRTWNEYGGDVQLFVEGNFDSFASVKGLEGITNEHFGEGGSDGKLSYDQRIWLIPQAQLLVSISPDSKQLQLVRVNPLKALYDSGKDFLVVTSEPEGEAKKGRIYRYQIEAKTSKGKITYQLQAGPEGMKISTEGQVTWNVPANLDDQPISVVISLRAGAAQQETLYSFIIEAGD